MQEGEFYNEHTKALRYSSGEKSLSEDVVDSKSEKSQ
jgi:hypothetical protein